MFGIPSLGKLLVLGLVIAAVFVVFRAINRRNEQVARKKPASRPSQSPSKGGGKGGDEGSLDMVQCPACKTYIPAGSKCSCGGSG